MKKKTTFLAFAFLLTQIGAVNAEGTPIIDGKIKLGINDTVAYSIVPQTGVKEYQWHPPKGCFIIEGQGTKTIKLVSTFLAQDGPLKVNRISEGGINDFISTPLTFSRYITGFVDHTIKPGESIRIAGKEVNTADIYYEDKGEEVIAHRVSVVPEVHVAQTKPYLQKMTDTSVTINWKTNRAGSPSVKYGKDRSDLSLTQKGSTAPLAADYFWHSVELTDLEPNTLYAYQVCFDGKESETYRFSTLPVKGSKQPMRILLMGDHQIKSRSGYEWLMQAAKRKINEKYGSLEENISLIMNVGDQVDVGTLDHYEHIHLFKSELMSPYLPIMTAVGNHETYNDTGMKNYCTHFDYANIEYRGITSGTDYYYAYQTGRVLFIVLDTEHIGNEQKSWVRKVVNAAQEDEDVDFIISVNHRPIQAEQYIGDISSWVRNEIIPILNQTPKHVLNYGGHHHLYHRGQFPDAPMYHIINGAASWDQMWGMSSEKDYDDVQKTIDYWGYQILEFDFDKKEMKAECYAIGNKELVVDNILIDTFHRKMNAAAPEKPALAEVPEVISLPYTFAGSDYNSTTEEPLNTVQFQIALTEGFETLLINSIRDVENLYGSTGRPLHIPVDINEETEVCKLTIEAQRLKNGLHYIRVRYRDANMEWSEWSDVKSFTVEGSIDGDPAVKMENIKLDLNADFTLSYEFAPVGTNAWIGVYHQGETPGTGAGTVESTVWGYTQGASGEMTFKLTEADEYYAVLFADGGYTEISPRLSFYAGPKPVLTTNKAFYEENEDITVSFENIPNLPSDWIGIYKMGKKIGSDYSDSWDYVNNYVSDGKMTLTKNLPKGYYLATYLLKGAYFEPGEPAYFSIGKDISTVSCEKTTYDIGEEIKIYYQDGPGTPKDWVGLFKEGKVVGVDELDAFYYTYSATDGFITIKPGDLTAGTYFCSLYINDSYDEISPRITFTIKDNGAVNIEQRQEDGLKVYYTSNTQSLQVENPDMEYQKIEIFSSTGMMVQNHFLKPGMNTIDISYQSDGMYLLRFKNKNGYAIRKIIKQ